MTTALPVVILTGGNWALEPVHHHPMLFWVMDAFRDAGFPVTASIGRWSGVGRDEKVTILPQQRTLSGNLWSALEHYANYDKVIITTCDIPCVTADGIRSYLHDALQLTSVGVVFPIVEIGVHPEFADFHATGIWVDGRRFTMGNIAVVSPAALQRQKKLVDEAIEKRKNVFALSAMLGLELTSRLAWAQLKQGAGLTLGTLETALGRLIQVPVKAIRSGDPGIGFDADNLPRLRILKGILEAR
jgi:hypothetical protein